MCQAERRREAEKADKAERRALASQVSVSVPQSGGSKQKDLLLQRRRERRREGGERRRRRDIYIIYNNNNTAIQYSIIPNHIYIYIYI